MTCTFPVLRECEREANLSEFGWSLEWSADRNHIDEHQSDEFGVRRCPAPGRESHRNFFTRARSAGGQASADPGSGADHVSSPGQASAEDAAVESASSEIEQISSAIEELQSRLVQANNQLGQVTAVRTTELEIGRLFVEAQRFSEASLSQLEKQIGVILAEAEAKAAQILREATVEAQEIRREAQQSAYFPARTAQELQSAIAGFSMVNTELVKELGVLNAMLTSTTEQTIEPSNDPSRALGPT